MTSGQDPLAALDAWERLEVGPVRVEPRRLTAPYTVVTGDGSETIDLSFRWEEDVFDPDDESDLNLATMVASQVALNYGLFCREIVFRGPFDRHDRRLLADAAANTAREIYVVKLLGDNPFLLGEAAELPVVRRDSYLRARLSFPDPAPHLRQRWRGDRARAAVLSSGGKESLLSYAALDEAGVEVHPVFVNESGHHWTTALTAYRRFAASVPRTTRVWTSSDRVFPWLARRLPFVRPDFGRVRSDVYPIRLWTVAVFTFAALPLLRRRGIGRLIVGDEYDTTRRATHEGVPHYDGLYDQSRYFDRAMTRYFSGKGWEVEQLSVLRPLSELLIEKILVERYPEWQELQVSCHAAHRTDEGVRPCGRCEKCRRIVAMLVALGTDPGRCGYGPDAVERCLAAFVEHGIHQEEAGAEEILARLVERGAVPPRPTPPERHPETVRLRFDRERSPADATPPDLRAPLWRIFLEHAEGAVRRRGRGWVEVDPLTEPSFAGVPSPETSPEPEHPWRLGELSWPQAARRFGEVDVALLPVGAVEQHGPHLPLDTDAWDAAHLADLVGRACTDPKPLVLPAIPYGVSYHHDDFAGTLSVGPETLARMVYEVGMAAVRHGITKLLILNGHGGNVPSLQFAAQMINRDGKVFTCVESGETSDADVERIADTRGDVHAGEIETSTALATRPGLVAMDRATPFVPRFPSPYLDFASSHGVDWYTRTSRISPSGVLGDPTRATEAKGERIWRTMIDHLVAFVEELKGASLDELHERHY